MTTILIWTTKRKNRIKPTTCWPAPRNRLEIKALLLTRCGSKSSRGWLRWCCARSRGCSVNMSPETCFRMRSRAWELASAPGPVTALTSTRR